jgi:hypothetical protein
MVSITNYKLFEDISEFLFDGHRVNLHDDFECTQIQFVDESGLFVFTFTQLEERQVVELQFHNARLSNLDIHFPLNTNASTLEIFYRGRFEEDGILQELTIDNEKIFYLEFNEGIVINLFAKEVTLDFKKMP